MERPMPTAYAPAGPRQGGETPRDRGVWARYASLLLGIWLFSSAFLWRHVPASETNTWAVGIIIGSVSLAAIRAPAARLANTTVAVWLLLSTLLMFDSSPATAWNNALVAAAVFLLSLVPNRGDEFHAL